MGWDSLGSQAVMKQISSRWPLVVAGPFAENGFPWRCRRQTGRMFRKERGIDLEQGCQISNPLQVYVFDYQNDRLMVLCSCQLRYLMQTNEGLLLQIMERCFRTSRWKLARSAQ